MKVTTQLYGQFLLNTPVNFTGTYFAETVEELEHDSVYRFLKNSKLTSKILKEKIEKVIKYSPNGRVLFDDSVLDKNSSSKIECATKQYSGNAHHVVMGIGVVTCVYYNPEEEKFYPLDYRIYDKKRDGKTKLDHVSDMIKDLIKRDKENQFFTHVLMDSWYATAELMNKLMDWDKKFVCSIRSNRLFSPDETRKTKPVKDLDWKERSCYHGKLKGLPAKRLVNLFRIVISSDKTEYIITNDENLIDSSDARKESAIRWKIEEFHKELKQLTGIEKCQARKYRSQRNHIAMSMLVWLQLKVKAWITGQSIYEIKRNPLKEFVANQWRNPATVFDL